METVIALQTFDGASNLHGTTTKTYEKGEIYDVHEGNAQCFVEGKLAKYYKRPKPEEAKPEEKAPDKGKTPEPASAKS